MLSLENMPHSDATMEDRSNFDHYVAQHYIRRFANSSGVIYIGDVHDRSVGPVTDTSRIMGARNWSVDQDIEDAFTSVEGQVATAFTRLNSEPTAITGLSPQTREGIMNFALMHYARSTGVHSNMSDTMQQMSSVLRPYASYSREIASMGNVAVTRPETLAMGADIASSIEPTLQGKGCVALIAPPGDEFILGDNPFVNLTSQEGWYMRGAIFSPETYFWLPLNPRVGLFFADGIGSPITGGPIRNHVITRGLTRELNSAEVYLAVDHIAGRRRGFVRRKVRMPNIGQHRSGVHDMGWAPFIITSNNAVYQIDRSHIDNLRNLFS